MFYELWFCQKSEFFLCPPNVKVRCRTGWEMEERLKQENVEQAKSDALAFSERNLISYPFPMRFPAIN